MSAWRVRIVFGLAITGAVAAAQTAAAAQGLSAEEAGEGGRTIIVRASHMLDGAGAVLTDRDIHIHDGRIARISAFGDRFDYDLRALTVMPGWIDTHAHIAARFDREGHAVLPNSLGAETREEAVLAVAANARATLCAGFTTVRSPGDELDTPVAWLSAAGALPGPRILSSRELIQGKDTSDPEAIRAAVRRMKAGGSDFIKLFADVHGDLSQEALTAGCDEARRQRLRTLVHASSLPAVKRAIAARSPQASRSSSAATRSRPRMERMPTNSSGASSTAGNPRWQRS